MVGRLLKNNEEVKNIPKAKYDYRVGGAIARNSRNKAQKEIVELLKASEETIMNKLNVIHHELKQEISTAQQKIDLVKQEVEKLTK